LSYSSSDYKSVDKLQSKVLDILTDIKEQKITIDQAITLKVLNILKKTFPIYMTILMKSARKTEEIPDLNTLFRNLTDEEARQRESVINLARNKGSGRRDKDRDKKDE
jgi:hypothetical protein